MSLIYTIKLALRRRAAQRLRRTVGPAVQGFLVSCDGTDMIIDVEDRVVGQRIARDGVYNVQERDRIIALVTPRSRVLFVGGHIGAIALPVARHCAHVDIIEANPVSARLLRANALLSQSSNVTVHEYAAGEQAGEVQFVLSRVNSGGAKIMPQHARHIYFYDRPEIVTVPVRALDDSLPQTYDLIVMDIEGSEYAALGGMSRLLAQAQTLVIEFMPHHLRDVAGVTVAQFVDRIAPYFDHLHIPSRKQDVARTGFRAALQDMYERDAEDDGLVFTKA